MNFPPDDGNQTVLAPTPEFPLALMRGTRLAEFEIQRVIGQGGFGIVYLAWDHSLKRAVAIKEYMPAAYAGRTSASHVSMLSSHHAQTFLTGLEHFVKEAQLLAQFDHPSLVRVFRYWEANGTAYMAMPYYEAPTLRALFLRSPSVVAQESWLRPFLDHILGALEVLHDRQYYHRDVAPDNILMLGDTVPLLLDFGAARRVISDMTQMPTAIFKPGYAPIEQYGDISNMPQGPWTDLYALASVVYYIITGKVPQASVSRLAYDTQVPLVTSMQGQYSEGFLHAIDSALQVRPENRPHNVAEFRTLLALPERAVRTMAAAMQPPPDLTPPRTRGAPPPQDPDATMLAPHPVSARTASAPDPDATMLSPHPVSVRGAPPPDPDATMLAPHPVSVRPTSPLDPDATMLAPQPSTTAPPPVADQDATRIAPAPEAPRTTHAGQGGEPVQPTQGVAPAAEPAPLSGAPGNGRRKLMLGAGALGVAAAALVYFTSSSKPGADRSAPPAVAAVPAAAPAPAQPAPAAPAAPAPAVAPACPLPAADGGDACPRMVEIPAGKYRIGAQKNDPGALPEELGGKEQDLAAFKLSAHEVTVGQWRLCVADKACPPAGDSQDPNLPVTNVSWNAAKGYADWLAKKTGEPYRLPTEAEWEYAARAGTSTVFPWGDSLDEKRAHCGQCGTPDYFDKLMPVGRFAAYGGLYDMLGNAYEWVDDCWTASHAQPLPPANGSCNLKVQKGGSYSSLEGDMRPVARTKGERKAGDPHVGFRIAR